MKLNWGFGITLFYLCFMTVLLYFVIQSTSFDNSLVMDDYYAQDLNYQAHFDKLRNTQELEQDIKIHYDEATQMVQFNFPEGMKTVEGTIQFFSPISKYRDVVHKINLDETGQMSLPTAQMPAGRWKVKLDWRDAKQAYFKETELFWE